MNTPICDYVKSYCDKNALRMHMPGHKGKPFLGMEAADITEIDGADVLYAPSGIIRESEENAASLFGSARTVYSAEGSSLSIRAILYLTMLYGKTQGKTTRIAAGRNAHKAFMNAAACLDVEIDWLNPEEGGDLLSCRIMGEQLERALLSMPEMPTAVYVTSPDYLGNLTDIAALSAVCRRYGVLLLVDNAHGAYLHFLPESRHPLALGADMCCDSAHKTLPVLTGGGYLHISRQAPVWFAEQADRAMALFASTSPSYLILQSLDRANVYLADGYRERLMTFLAAMEKRKNTLRQIGYTLTGDEDSKITILTKPYGYTGTDLAEILQKEEIFCEFADPDYLVMMCTPENTAEELERVIACLSAVQKREPILSVPPAPPRGKRVMSVRDAMLSAAVLLPAEECEGRILASASVNCPPAVPIAVCGERIEKETVACLDYYGISACYVVEENDRIR